MAKTTDGRPRHQQIAAELRDDIMSGKWEKGRFPTVQRLMERFDAHNQTIQNAVDVLKTEGLIVSKTGVGTFIRDREPLVVDSAAYLPTSADGYQYDLLKVEEAQPPADVAKVLGLDDQGVAVLRQRVLMHQGNPVELSWSYYPVEIARGTKLAAKRKILGGAPEVLRNAGYPEVDMEDIISTRMPTPTEVDVLDLPEVPVIRTLRTVFSYEERPVEVSVLVKGGHLHAVRYRQAAQ